MEPDSHWQISYNLGCFYAIRSQRLAGEDRQACKRMAITWLERALDRPASSQLVHEWLSADGDLKPLRGRTDFQRWASRVKPVAREPAARPGVAPAR